MNEIEEIRSRIHTIRGQQVMLDFDLAELYGVETSQLKRAVRRNLERFPADFMFELNSEEFNSLKMSIRCQIGILSNNQSEMPKYAPFAFTEQGVAMLSGVLRSPIAVEVNIRIMRTFVAVRQYLAAPPCGNCQLEADIKRLAAYIEEVLADANDRDEMMEKKIDKIENTIDILQANVAMLQANLYQEEQEPREKRIFEMEVKGFKKEE